MMNLNFVLIDLYAQREAVYGYVDGWSKEQILAWMCQYGGVLFHAYITHLTQSSNFFL